MFSCSTNVRKTVGIGTTKTGVHRPQVVMGKVYIIILYELWWRCISDLRCTATGNCHQTNTSMIGVTHFTTILMQPVIIIIIIIIINIYFRRLLVRIHRKTEKKVQQN